MAETGSHGSTALQSNGELDLKRESEREAQQNSIEVLEQQMSQLFKMRVDVNDLDPEHIIVKCNKIETGPVTFFVHPIEGIATPLKRVTDKCNFPVYCFQFTRNVPDASIEEVAQKYIGVRRSCFQNVLLMPRFPGDEEGSTPGTVPNHRILLRCLHRLRNGHEVAGVRRRQQRREAHPPRWLAPLHADLPKRNAIAVAHLTNQ